MNKETYHPMINVGIVGFNVIEECGIVHWVKECFPQVKVHLLKDVHEQPAIDGLLINDRAYGALKLPLNPSCPILLLTNGPHGCAMCKEVINIDTLGDSVVVKGGIEKWLSQLIRSQKSGSEQVRNIRLSQRELQIAEKLLQGCKNDAISMELGIEVTTVKTHLHRIYMKLGAVNRAHAVALFCRKSFRTSEQAANRDLQQTP
jgi:DNA-binding CsgD family transcriptional regulator